MTRILLAFSTLNHVVLDLGGGHYALYAHLEPGSLRVKTGDRVQRGQVLGLVGNTGDSYGRICTFISPMAFRCSGRRACRRRSIRTRC